MIREVMSFVCAGAVESLGPSLSALLFSEERLSARPLSGTGYPAATPAEANQQYSAWAMGHGGTLPILRRWRPSCQWWQGPTSGRYVQAFQGRNSPVKRLHRDSGQAGRVSPLARDAGRVQTKRTASQLAGALSPSGDSTAGAFLGGIRRVKRAAHGPLRRGPVRRRSCDEHCFDSCG